MQLAFSLSAEERCDYKLINEYRLKNGWGNYVRAIEQHQVLENDKDGNCWLALSILDLSPNQDLDTKVLSKLFNFKSGKIVAFDKNQGGRKLDTPLVTGKERS